MSCERGTVVWSVDPFKDDPGAGRPWLVVSNDRQPFDDEQSMTVHSQVGVGSPEWTAVEESVRRAKRGGSLRGSEATEQPFSPTFLR